MSNTVLWQDPNCNRRPVWMTRHKNKVDLYLKSLSNCKPPAFIKFKMKHKLIYKCITMTLRHVHIIRKSLGSKTMQSVSWQDNRRHKKKTDLSAHKVSSSLRRAELASAAHLQTVKNECVPCETQPRASVQDVKALKDFWPPHLGSSRWWKGQQGSPPHFYFPSSRRSFHDLPPIHYACLLY